MPSPNTPITLVTNTAQNVGDNVYDPGAISPLPAGALPVVLMLSVRAHSIATGTLTVRVEYSLDGTNWGLADPTQAMTGITTAIVASKRFDLAFPRWRVVSNLSAGTAAISIVAYTTST